MDSAERAGLRSSADAMRDELVRIRRTIHRRPELGFQERETADFIEAELEALGISERRREGTALVALLRGGKPGPCVALRADMDALPIREETDLPYASELPGKMHACGHDGHVAIALGAARLLAQRRGRFGGSVKFLFQPAEETDGGAEPMIRSGCMENPRVDRVYGLHVMPYLPVGTVEVKRGALNGSSATLSITVVGKGGHGAYPESGVDAILAAAATVTALNTLVSRAISPLDQAVLTVGTIQGGVASNVIAEEVRMRATLRTTDDGVRDLLVRRVRETVQGTCDAYGAAGMVEVAYGYIALVNDDRETDRIAAVAASLLGADAVRWKEKPSMGVEDFSFFLKEAPGAFYHLGCAPSGAASGGAASGGAASGGAASGGAAAPLHSSRFVLHEDCLPIGAALQAALCLEALEDLSTAR